MIYTTFSDKRISLLGFGAMRLPTCPDGSIDEKKTFEMVDYAIANGVNYFDTAWPYHNGESERVIGKALARHDRSKIYLADKYPGHQVSEKYDPADIFEEQLKRCGVEYFDFYLLHNVYEKSINTYFDPRWGIIDYFKEQKRLGRIKHLGFSTHGDLSTIKEFLEKCDVEMEFCQIQLNYLDWTLQNAKEKYEFLREKGIPVIVMEPVRGGGLASLNEQSEKMLHECRPESSYASWAFRFLQKLPGIMTVLSGMSDFRQTEDNIRTFTDGKYLTDKEFDMLLDIAETLKDSVPCTSCRYCCDGCTMGLDIPRLIGIYNELRVSPVTNIAMRIEWLPEDKKPSACISCGKCTQICPQKIDIPHELENLTATLEKIPTWAEVCRQRELSQRRTK